ncbi:hypothetical protein FJTKL_15371 [Diaporthe vaccinii]|uniref:Uncharacterized protein n=1 Tax=Diaporthe vaccinii TaxID=105482 RepID=A0ABR4E530_9PEZI
MSSHQHREAASTSSTYLAPRVLRSVMSRCRGCSDVSVLHWTRGNGSWQRRRVPAPELRTADLTTWDPLNSTESDVCVVANEIRACPRCRPIFTGALHIPEIWWSDCCRRSNGYFGCDVINKAGNNHEYNTWLYFETKHLGKNTVYDKLNVFAQWLQLSQQSVVVLFDVCEPVMERVSDLFRGLDSACSYDPFWIHAQLATEVARREDAAIWAVRDHIRAMEKEGIPTGRPHPDYRRLHDVVRHAIHVSETLNVAKQTMSRIIAEHDAFISSELATDRNVSRGVQHRLRFAESMLASLQDHSVSNEKRLLNEIQLAFPIVAQHDANTSVEIGRLARSDGVAMKTIAFVTLAFLPSTFVSAIFSMSFFTFSADAGWVVSGKIWVYWVFAVSLILVSFVLWRCWLVHGSAIGMSRFEKKSAHLPSGLIETAVRLSERHL